MPGGGKRGNDSVARGDVQHHQQTDAMNGARETLLKKNHAEGSQALVWGKGKVRHLYLGGRPLLSHRGRLSCKREEMRAGKERTNCFVQLLFPGMEKVGACLDHGLGGKGADRVIYVVP